MMLTRRASRAIPSCLDAYCHSRSTTSSWRPVYVRNVYSQEHAQKLSELANGWKSQSGVKSLFAVDCHAAGEPARIVVQGLPDVTGSTMMEKRHTLMTEMDYIRKILLLEPRGYPCQNANLIFESNLPESKYGYVILEQNKIYPAMSGHNTICVATALLESGMVAMEEPMTTFTLEAPCGPIKIEASCRKGKAESIRLHNAPAFVEVLDAVVEVPELGEVTVDIAFGGMWYVVVNKEMTAKLGLDLLPAQGGDICRLGEMIKVAAREQIPVNHPEYDYPGPDILVFRGPPQSEGVDSRNAVVMSNKTLDWENPSTWTGMLDRSPCGTGTCAVMATMHARGELGLNERFVHESIVGTQFVGELHAEAHVGKYNAVVPSVSGQAWITQLSTVILHPTDPFQEGYTVGDIW